MQYAEHYSQQNYSNCCKMTNTAVYYFNICYIFNNKRQQEVDIHLIIAFQQTTKQKRLPQIWQISTDAFCSKVLCKSAESVGVFIPLCLVGALREHLKGVLSGGALVSSAPTKQLGTNILSVVTPLVRLVHLRQVHPLKMP